MNRSIDVIAYAGYRGEQEPRAVVIDSECRRVREIRRRWRSPDGCYFEVELVTGERLVLRYGDNKEPGWSFVPQEAR